MSVEVLSKIPCYGGKSTLEHTSDGALVHKTTKMQEALIYLKMQGCRDKMLKYCPQFHMAQRDNKVITVGDKGLEEGGASLTLNNRERKTVVVLENLLQGKSHLQAYDLKLCKIRDQLCNPEELKHYGHASKNKVKNFIRFHFMRWLSGLSWVLTGRGFFQTIYKGCRTKTVLRKAFLGLEPEERSAAVKRLEEIQSAMQESAFGFVSASLFVCIYESEGKKQCSIHLIDLAHGMEKSANLPSFGRVQKAGAEAIGEFAEWIKALDKQA